MCVRMYICMYVCKVKWSRYRPGVAQRVGRGIALLFHDRGTRRGRVVSSTPRPHFTPEKDWVPNLQEAGWAPGSAWTGGKSRPHRDSIPDLSARSHSLYRLSYPAHMYVCLYVCIHNGCNVGEERELRGFRVEPGCVLLTPIGKHVCFISGSEVSETGRNPKPLETSKAIRRNRTDFDMSAYG